MRRHGFLPPQLSLISKHKQLHLTALGTISASIELAYSKSCGFLLALETEHTSLWAMLYCTSLFFHNLIVLLLLTAMEGGGAGEGSKRAEVLLGPEPPQPAFGICNHASATLS